MAEIPPSDDKKTYTRRRALQTLGTLALGFVAGERFPQKSSAGANSNLLPTTDSGGLKQAELKNAGITSYEMLNDSSSPRHYAAFRDTYDKLVALVPKSKQKYLIMPVTIVFQSTEDNAHHILRRLREDSIIAISSQTYEKATDAELAYNFAHELGHWLDRTHPALAADLGGLTAPSVQPLLKILKMQVQRASESGEADQLYQTLCNELVADGIAVRLSCNPAAGISDLQRGARHNMDTTIADILDGYRFGQKEEKERLAHSLRDILQQVRRDGVSDHPSEKFREEYMNRVAAASGCGTGGIPR